MADFTLSPNMSMPVPTVSEAPGPGWATNIDASLSIVDSHNHSAGQGVQINPAGININTDLPFNNQNATVVRSVNFTAQLIPLSLVTDIGCLYVSGVDLYYNDENGNQIRITQSGSVAGSSGTITGLPSGTASASYSAGTFTFQAATNTPAAMHVGPVTIGNSVASSNTVTIAPNASIASNYNLTLPPALPAGINYVTLDNSGNLAFNSSGFTGSGAVVLATSPTITSPSMPSGVIFTSGTLTDYVQSTWVPVFSNLSNVTSASANGPMRYQRIGDNVYCTFNVSIVVTSVGVYSVDMSLPIPPNNNWNTSTDRQACLWFGVPQAGVANLAFSPITGNKTLRASGNSSGTNSNSSFVIYNINN